MAIITSVPESYTKFPMRKDDLKRFNVEGVVYAKSAAEAKDIVVESGLTAARVEADWK